MKYYKDLLQYHTFTLNDTCQLIGNIDSAKQYLKELVKKNEVHRIKKNLYTCYDFAKGEDCANRFQIASGINTNSYISYHSAFEFYGFYNQMYYDLQVSSDKRFSKFEYDNYSYKCYVNDISIQIDYIQGVKVTSIERTIVDSIDMLGKVMDIEELVKCLNLIHLVNENKLIEVLKAYNKDVLYRKVGYILSFYMDDFNLNQSFFDFCLSNSNINNIGYLVNNDKSNLVFNKYWGLYGYQDIKTIASKGGEIDV